MNDGRSTKRNTTELNWKRALFHLGFSSIIFYASKYVLGDLESRDIISDFESKAAMVCTAILLVSTYYYWLVWRLPVWVKGCTVIFGLCVVSDQILVLAPVLTWDLAILGYSNWEELDRDATGTLAYMAYSLMIIYASVQLGTGLRRSQDLLHDLALGTSHLVGGDFLKGIAVSLGRALKVSNVILLEQDPQHPQVLRVTASYGKDSRRYAAKFVEPPSPAAKLLNFDSRLRANEESPIFMDEVAAEELGVATFISLPLYDVNGHVVGFICFLHEEPLELRADAVSCVRIFASRAAVEIERIRADREHEQLQEGILQTQKLESLGILAGGIAHDFNNLMTGIVMHSEALLAQEADASMTSSLQQISHTAQHASGLCRQLLAFSGRGKAVKRVFELDDVVISTVTLMQHVVSKSITISFESTSTDVFVDGDPSQVGQIVLNLIKNAAEAITADGEVYVRTGRGTARDGLTVAPDRLRDADTHAIIEVSDNGCGMDEETVRRIFDPFFSTKEYGHGLGLAATIGIARSHEGSIDVKSTPDQGTTFCVALPLAAAPTEPPSLEYGITDRRGTILVIDDDAKIRSMMRSGLEREGMSVICAKDGSEGLEIFRQHAEHVSAILLDVDMPALGGIETYEELRQLGAVVPILMMSGHANFERVRSLPQNVPFVEKPFSIATVVKSLEGAFAA